MGSCWVHAVLRLRHHPSKGDPRCFKTGKLTVHHQPFNKMTQSIFIILIQLSCFVSTNLNIFQNLFFFICRTIPSKNFTSHSNHIIHMYMSTAIACGVHIFGIERQPCNSDTRGKQRIMSNSLYTASSSVSGSRMVSAHLAQSSLGVLRLHSHPTQSTISLLTKLHINIHYPPTIILPYIN